MYMLDQSRHQSRFARVLFAGTALMLTVTHSVSAQQIPFPQLTSYLYSASFICGNAEPATDAQSNGDPFLSPYDDLEPGSYSTLLSVQNTAATARSISFFVSAQGLPNRLFIDSLSLTPLETRRFGCLDFMDEVAANWPTPLFGQAIQGTVYFVQTADVIDLISTQSYSAVRRDGDSGVGGVSVDVTRETPRDLGRLVFLPQPFSP